MSEHKVYDKVGDTPIRIMIGTCPGDKKDAEAMARNNIHRYFQLEENSWFYLQEEKGVGYHYEIHEGGSGKPILPSILGLKDLKPGQEFHIKPRNDRWVKIVVRPDNSLRSLVMPTNSEEFETSTELKSVKKKMIPYANTGQDWLKVGLMVMSLGLTVAVSAGIVQKAFDLQMQGYSEIAENLPTYRVAELAGIYKHENNGIPTMDSLPISQWQRIMAEDYSNGRYLAKLEYNGKGEWKRLFKTYKASDPEVTADAAPTVEVENNDI